MQIHLGAPVQDSPALTLGQFLSQLVEARVAAPCQPTKEGMSHRAMYMMLRTRLSKGGDLRAGEIKALRGLLIDAGTLAPSVASASIQRARELLEDA